MTSRTDWAAIDGCLSAAVGAAGGGERPAGITDPRLDWLAIMALANREFVTPALWTGLARCGGQDDIPADARDYLALLHQQNVERNARIARQCRTIGQALDAAGLQATLLKGATWLFDDPVQPDRMMRDIDLLMPAGTIETAVEVLRRIGYRDMGGTEDGHFHVTPLLPPDGEASVEIHRDLAHRAGLVPAADLLAEATPVAAGLLMPAIHHRIAHNVVHAQVENGDWVAGLFSLRDGLDLARLVARGETACDWQRLAAEARARGLFPVLSGAIHTAHRILASPLPPPFAGDRKGRLHGWRCETQRHWPVLARISRGAGLLSRATAWERDAYALNLGPERGWRAHARVNARRTHRIKASFSRWLASRSAGPET